ncbi:MAG: sodium:solute symporter, partial [Planctomycetes bacterium]|nr:sodium:solute symporter [Planctomycetota bacterium]
AFMSTFSSTVNAGASFVVRDLWQPILAPRAGERALIRSSYLATMGIVVVGILVGYQAESIASIWEWMMMALVAGVIVPNVLRWYWWRLNGWGYAAGVLGGIGLSFIALFTPDLPVYWAFPAICLGSAAGCIAGSLATEPTDFSILAGFYRSVRPFGAWGPLARRIAREQGSERARGEGAATALHPGRVTFNTIVAIGGITGLYLAPMYLVGHWHAEALAWLSVVAVSAGVLYFTWYRHLPPPGEGSG